MALEFVGKDPESRVEGSPAVFVDTDTGDLVFQGRTETDAAVLAEINRCSRTSAGESSVRLPARMIPIILEAIHGGTFDG